MKLQNLVNHIVFVLDQSGSMMNHKDALVNVVDGQIKYLSRRSQELNQETRVSVYLFSEQVKCIIYDMDVMRLPSLKGLYNPSGGTALLDATAKAIEDLKLTPTIYGDHHRVVYIWTDGEENRSYKTNAQSLKKLIGGVGDGWSIATLVPDQSGYRHAQSCGFDVGNISIWEVSKGVDNVGERVQAATESFFQARASGKKVGNIFQLNTNLSPQKIVGNLDVLDANKYMVINIRKDRTVIKDAVESWSQKPYVVGSAYYQLTKKEKIQASKNILIKHKKNGKVYEGDAARKLLGLPDYEVKCEPASLPEWNIYVQSSSVNRLLMANTELIVLL